MTGLTSLSGIYQTVESYGYPSTPNLRRFVQMALHVAWFQPQLKLEVHCKKQLNSFWAKVEPGIL